MEKTQKISWIPLILVSAASFVAALDETFMNVSISQVVKDLDTDVGTIQTIMSLYTLITASLMLITSKLQDIIGKRTIFVAGAIIYGAGTLTAALSPNVIVLFLGWALLEGVGGACMTPCVISIITGTYDGERRTSALAISSAIVGISAGIGPLYGGIVTSYISWRVGFGLEFLIIIGIIVLHRKIPYFESTAEKSDLDITGSILSVLGLLLLIIGILQLEDQRYALSVGLIIGSFIILAAFGFFELRRVRMDKVPLFDVRLFKYRNLTIGTLIRLSSSIAVGGALFSVSVFLQSALELSAIRTGLMLLPLTLGMLLVSSTASKFATRFGHKGCMLFGFAVAIVGCLILSRQFTTDATFLDLAPGMFIFGVGLGFPMSLATDASLEGIPAEAQNSCSGLSSIGQTLGMSMGTAIIGVIMLMGAKLGLADAVVNIMGVTDTSAEGIRNAAETYVEKMGNVDPSTLVGGDKETYDQIKNTVIQDGMGVVMYVSAALMLVSGGLTCALKGKKKEAKEEKAE